MNLAYFLVIQLLFTIQSKWSLAEIRMAKLHIHAHRHTHAHTATQMPKLYIYWCLCVLLCDRVCVLHVCHAVMLCYSHEERDRALLDCECICFNIAFQLLYNHSNHTNIYIYMFHVFVYNPYMVNVLTVRNCIWRV